MRLFLALAAFVSTIGAAPRPPVAGALTVYVRGPGNAPIRDAVVTVHLRGRATPAPVGRGYAVEQRNIEFHPFVSVVPVGAEVVFPNLDPIRHHVYSFSAAKRFELKLYAKEQNRAVRFDRPGIVALGCNIHDQMSAFIAVVDTVYAVKTDGSGNAVFSGLPAGDVSIEVWHPYLRAPANKLARNITVGATGAAETFAVSLRSPPRMTGSMQY